MTESHRLADRASTLAAWLRGQLLREAALQLFQGILFGMAGLIAVAAATALAMVALSTLQSSLHSPSDLMPPPDPIVSIIIFTAILAASIHGALRRHWEALAFRSRRATLSNGFFRRRLQFAAELPGVAPGLHLAAGECLAKTWRMVRLVRDDLEPAAALLLWLFDKGRKARVEEISASFPGPEAVRLLPLLRDVPGVIWLTYHHGVIILSEELRQRARAVLGRPAVERKPPPAPEPEPEPEFGRQPPEDGPFDQSAEQVGWYLALDLPPFAPLAAVKQRYRQLVKIHHPDATAGRSASGRPGSDERFKAINAAYHNILRCSKAVPR